MFSSSLIKNHQPHKNLVRIDRKYGNEFILVLFLVLTRHVQKLISYEDLLHNDEKQGIIFYMIF